MLLTDNTCSCTKLQDYKLKCEIIVSTVIDFVIGYIAIIWDMVRMKSTAAEQNYPTVTSGQETTAKALTLHKCYNVNHKIRKFKTPASFYANYPIGIKKWHNHKIRKFKTPASFYANYPIGNKKWHNFTTWDYTW